MLRTGTAWLADKLATIAGEPVTYARGGDETELIAVPGQAEFEQADDFGIVHRLECRDFLIRPSELVIAGAKILPTAGDRISATRDGQTYVYEVMAPGDEPAWRYSNRYRHMLRIHTKLIDSEEES